MAQVIAYVQEGTPLPEKPVTMAIQEVARGELTATLKEKYRK